jgi:hypothetical protein
MAQQPVNTNSLDLPPLLQGILKTPTVPQNTPPMPMQAPAPMQNPMPMQSLKYGGEVKKPMYSYQAGGQVGPAGQPVGLQSDMQQQGGSPSQPMNPEMMEMQVQEFMTRNPQQVQQIKNAVMEAVQTGELSIQELNQLGQLATAAMRNPSMYPQIRQFIIQQGIATEQDIPPQYDEGLIFSVILASQAAQGGSDMMTASQPMPSMGGGGQVPASMASTGEVPIMAHEKEFVIPKWLVEEKGTAFFKSMIDKGPMDAKNKG